MDLSLKGKSAVVTGGGGGIGKEVALALASEGASVVVNDISRDAEGRSLADEVVNEIIKARGIAVANHDSVATMKGGENIIKTATSNYGRIDILINCAGNFKVAPIFEMSEEDWDSIMAVHLKGHFSCIRAAAIEMIPQKNGRIINVSSRAAFSYMPGNPSAGYSTAKAGILGLTTVLSQELKQYNITVNAILPSAITHLFPNPRLKFGGGETVGPEFITPLVVYLALDEAADITGQFLYVSGGDIIILDQPVKFPGPHKFIRKIGKWTLKELSEVIPPLLEIS